MATSTATHEVQEQVLSVVRKSQEVTLDAIRAWVETVSVVTSKLPSVPSITVPFADKLPAPEAVVSTAYDFAEQLLGEQRTFAGEVLKATAALRVSAAEQAPAEQPTPAKRAVSRAAAK